MNARNSRQRQKNAGKLKDQLRAESFESQVADEQAGRLLTPLHASSIPTTQFDKRMTLACCTAGIQAGIPRSFRASTSSVVIISFRATKDQ